MGDEYCWRCQDDLGEPLILAAHNDDERPAAFGKVPAWREIPAPLPPRAAALLHMHALAAETVAAGGVGGVARLGTGYREREACFRYHRIADPEIQDLIVGAFRVITSANAEGQAGGERQREKEREERDRRK